MGIQTFQEKNRNNLSQLDDGLMMIRNYAKQPTGLFARFAGKVAAFTMLQYINFDNHKPIGHAKYVLF